MQNLTTSREFYEAGFGPTLSGFHYPKVQFNLRKLIHAFLGFGYNQSNDGLLEILRKAERRGMQFAAQEDVYEFN